MYRFQICGFDSASMTMASIRSIFCSDIPQILYICIVVLCRLFDFFICVLVTFIFSLFSLSPPQLSILSSLMSKFPCGCFFPRPKCVLFNNLRIVRSCLLAFLLERLKEMNCKLHIVFKFLSVCFRLVLQ